MVTTVIGIHMQAFCELTLMYWGRYVKTVPLAAQLLDVKTSQKREMIKELKLEQARYRLEVEIGKSPPLSDKELFMELHQKA